MLNTNPLKYSTCVSDCWMFNSYKQRHTEKIVSNNFYFYFFLLFFPQYSHFILVYTTRIISNIGTTIEHPVILFENWRIDCESNTTTIHHLLHVHEYLYDEKNNWAQLIIIRITYTHIFSVLCVTSAGILFFLFHFFFPFLVFYLFLNFYSSPWYSPIWSAKKRKKRAIYEKKKKVQTLKEKINFETKQKKNWTSQKEY